MWILRPMWNLQKWPHVSKETAIWEERLSLAQLEVLPGVLSPLPCEQIFWPVAHPQDRDLSVWDN